MEHSELEKYIEKANKNEIINIVYDENISKTVRVIYIHKKEPCLYDIVDIFFLIRNKRGRYVSIVYDMVSDLHWFTLEKERNKGHITRALKNYIIPYIFKNRGEIRVTTSSRRGSSSRAVFKIVEKLGFRKIGKKLTITEFELSRGLF